MVAKEYQVTINRVHAEVAVAVVAVVVVAMLVGMATAVIITHKASWQLTHFPRTYARTQIYTHNTYYMATF
jgi:hypothetical protein